jgi:hypothetical protein
VDASTGLRRGLRREWHAIAHECVDGKILESTRTLGDEVAQSFVADLVPAHLERKYEKKYCSVCPLFRISVRCSHANCATSFARNLIPLAWKPRHYTGIVPHAERIPRLGHENALCCSKVRCCAGESPRRISNFITLSCGSTFRRAG